MLTGLLNRLRGQVRVRAECAFPERVLNLCGARDLSFWDLEWESPTAFTCRLGRRDFAVLQEAAARLECNLTVVGREGAPFFLGRFRHRAALTTGLVACGLGLFLGSFFIWDFQVTGNEAVSTERILRALEDCGVGPGTFGLSLDGEDIRNHVLLEVPELSWIAVNVSGCRAEVQVRERVPKPEMVDERTPANVVARRAGLVLEVRAPGGYPCVLPGSSVAEGQLLISGVEDTDTFGARLLAGMGSVEARTWHTLTATMPLTVRQKRYTGRERTCVSAVFGTRRIKFFRNSSIAEEEYDKITTRRRLTLLGVSLPVTVEAETLRFYELETAARTPAQAERAAEALLQERLRAEVEPYGQVASTLCASRRDGDALVVTLSAECREDIARRVPIYTG